jgi:hypothetical protein
MTEEDITVLKHMISEREDLLKKAPTKLLVRGDFIDKALTLLNDYGIKIDSEESTKPFNLEGITKLANDMLVQNTVLRKKLGEVENQRDNLLAANTALYTQIETQVVVISRLERQRTELLEVLERLSVAAQDKDYYSLDAALHHAYIAIERAKGE